MKDRAEEQLKKVADERRAQYESSPEATAKHLSEYKVEIAHLITSTRESVQSVEKAVDSKGNIYTTVVPGIAFGASSPDKLVRSNFRSRQERLNRLLEIDRELSQLIDAFRSGRKDVGLPCATLNEYIAWLRSTIPNRNVLEVISGKRAQGSD